MRKKRSSRDIGFDSHDRGRLTRALRRVTDVRAYWRLQAVLLVAQGLSVTEVAGLTGTRPWAVYSWIRAYIRTHDPGALGDAPRRGRPPVPPAITDARIRREFLRDPLRLGYTTTAWTAELFARHLHERYGQQLSPYTLRRRMRRLGLRWKRPRHTYGTKDPNRAQKKGGLYAA